MKRPPSNPGMNQYRKETTHKIVKRGSPANMMGGGDPYSAMNLQTLGKSKNLGMMNRTMQESQQSGSGGMMENQPLSNMFNVNNMLPLKSPIPQVGAGGGNYVTTDVEA